MTDTLAEIAARYGAIIPDGLTVTVIPKGVSSIPYPVWREGAHGPGLYQPDGAKQFRAAMWSHVPKPKRPKPVKEPKPRKERTEPPKPLKPVAEKTASLIRPLHAAGMTNKEIAAATGKKPGGVKELIRRLGLKSNTKRKTNNGE